MKRNFIAYSLFPVGAAFSVRLSTVLFSTASDSSTFCDAATPKVELKETYESLKGRLREIERLEGINGLLSWDEAVMMPQNSGNARNQQKGALAGVAYEKKINPELGEEIKILNQFKTPEQLGSWATDFDIAVIRDAARDYDISTKKTKEITTKIAELEGKGFGSWAEARKNDDWQSFKPVLKELIGLKKEVAAVTKPGLSSYDANIDDFERGMSEKRISDVFSVLKTELNPFIKKILTSEKKKKYVPPAALKGGPEWAVEKQKALCIEIATKMGFDFNKGRFDISLHPFTGGAHPTDVRITTRYSEKNWKEGVAGTVHETGHALYEQGRNSDYEDLPVSRSLSMGVHESQSLFWERMIFQSYDFWVWATPIVHKHFPHTKDVTPEQFYEFVNQVQPGLIRVEADEITYPLHIILRFEMEKLLMDDKNEVDFDKLPLLWREEMKKGLGVQVENDKNGILQDVHWSFGAFGYFPSYTLGAIIAVQLYETALTKIPNLKEKIQKGEFQEIREFLRENIHSVGSLYESPDELLTKVTGSPMKPELFVNYLKKKYSALYGLK